MVIVDTTVWIDAETWLQVGIRSTNAEGGVIGEYYFRDIRLNPQFNPKQFTRDALQP